jgi:hypothetical protein
VLEVGWEAGWTPHFAYGGEDGFPDGIVEARGGRKLAIRLGDGEDGDIGLQAVAHGKEDVETVAASEVVYGRQKLSPNSNVDKVSALIAN